MDSNTTTRFELANQVATWTNVNARFKFVSDRLKTSQNLALYFVEQESGSVKTKKKAYHPDIDIHCQENAWADTKVSIEWVKKTLTEAVRGDDWFVLFCENLTGQVTTELKEAVAKLGRIVWYGLPGATVATR